MKSYWMQIADGKATIELRDVAQLVPGPGQMLVRIRAASLNRGEFILNHGLHKPGAPKPIGMEAAGVVVSCGEGVTEFKPGDRVMGRCPGAFAEYGVMDEREAMRIPTRFSFEEGASIPLVFLVVHDMLVLQGHLKPGQWVLIPGVSSGVGVASLLMAKALGARVIGTSGSQKKLDRLAALGLDLGLCTRKPDFYDAVMRATNGQGVHLVVNTVGGSMFAECVRCLTFEGRLATVGYVDNQLNAEIDIEALHAKRLTLFGVSNKLRSADQRAEFVPNFKSHILPLMDAGHMTPVIDHVFPFEQLEQAKAMMDANEHLGKIVLRGSAD